MFSPCILLVDDSRASRSISSTFLKLVRPDCDVWEAADGPAALHVLREGSIDLGILDMNMPGMSGLDLAEIIQRQQLAAQLVILTANAQFTVRKRASSMRVPLFRKPVTRELIVDILSLLPSAQLDGNLK